jgi:hypothetical protein
MHFMFNNEEGLAQTSEILLQNCYSALKDSGIVSCKILSMNDLEDPTGTGSDPGRKRRAVRLVLGYIWGHT